LNNPYKATPGSHGVPADLVAAASPLLVRCNACEGTRIVAGLTAAVVRDAMAQGLHPPCLLRPTCLGSLEAVDAPAPVHERPPRADNGRHVAACPACHVPLEFAYLYGYSPRRCGVGCPSCGADLSHVADDWPRGPDGAVAMDLRVRLAVAPRKANVPPPGIELAPLLRP